jgi:putative transposase
MKRKSYSPKEIASKLQQADKLAEEGQSQSEIVKVLGISTMTYHRWRKARQKQTVVHLIPKHHPAGEAAAIHVARIKDLELENARLRQLVTDSLLDKLKLQEILDVRTKTAARPVR